MRFSNILKETILRKKHYWNRLLIIKVCSKDSSQYEERLRTETNQNSSLLNPNNPSLLRTSLAFYIPKCKFVSGQVIMIDSRKNMDNTTKVQAKVNLFNSKF